MFVKLFTQLRSLYFRNLTFTLHIYENIYAEDDKEPYRVYGARDYDICLVIVYSNENKTGLKNFKKLCVQIILKLWLLACFFDWSFDIKENVTNNKQTT